MRPAWNRLLLGLSCGAVALSPGAAVAADRALMVVVADYPEDRGYGDALPIRGSIEMMQAAFGHLGVAPDHITLLTDEAATRAGIDAAIRKTLLEPAQPGDRLVFYYTGHGDQLPDEVGGDEGDGLDEALAPWGAPAGGVAGPDYDGSAHLRDDVLWEHISALRARVGPSGHVLVILDSCSSGSGARGTEGELGHAPGGSAKAVAAGGADEGSGFGRVVEADDALAPVVLLAAARHDQAAQYAVTPWGTSGVFTAALHQAVLDLPAGATYAELSRYIAGLLATAGFDQSVQLEGPDHLVAFDGAAPAGGLPIPVERVEGTTLALGAGSFVGLKPGDRLAVNSLASLRAGTPLAMAQVDTVDLARATATLDTSLSSASGLRVVRLPPAGPQLPVLGLDDKVPAEVRGVLGDRVAQGPAGVGALNLQRAGRGHGVLVEAATGIPVGPKLSWTAPELADAVETVATRWSRAQVLREPGPADPEAAIALELFVVEPRADVPGEPCVRSPEPVADSPAPDEAGAWTLSPGTYFQLGVDHQGSVPTWLRVLAVDPTGAVRRVWPELPPDVALSPGGMQEVTACMWVGDVPGPLDLVAIASSEPLWGTHDLLEGEDVDLLPTVAQVGSRGVSGPKVFVHRVRVHVAAEP